MINQIKNLLINMNEIIQGIVNKILEYYLIFLDSFESLKNNFYDQKEFWLSLLIFFSVSILIIFIIFIIGKIF